ncbi:MAG: MaoC family dehydratase N-terminal domain-containing protein [Austwickia sp.]|nr:MAG: MaoC family dehydratase N-terminal domain-containing protein [Austwickia sp.]
MSTRRPVDAVGVGREFGFSSLVVDRERLIAYAAASGDHNRIHWDEAFARSVGLPDVIAHGMWTMGAAIDLVCRWAGDPTAVVDYRTKFTAPVVVPYDTDVRVEVRGLVKSLAEDDPAGPRAVVELIVTCGGEQALTRAQATVLLARAGEEVADFDA